MCNVIIWIHFVYKSNVDHGWTCNEIIYGKWTLADFANEA